MDKKNASSLPLLRKLEWRLRHAVETSLSGEYRSSFRGRGMEFDQVVRYEYGDDIRDIDWNVTARLGEPYRKKFVEERELTLFLIIEDTPALQFGSADRTKRESLLELAGLLMLLGALNRDRVGYIHLTDTDYHLSQPARGRLPIHHAAARLLATPPPPLSPSSPPLERGNLSPLSPGRLVAPQISNLRSQIPSVSSVRNSPHPLSAIAPLLTRTIPRHSVLIWLGEHPARPTPPIWPLLQKRYQTIGIRADDPWDLSLPTDRNLTAYDPLTNRLLTLNNTHAQRAAHAAWKSRREQSWLSLFPNPRNRLALPTTASPLDSLVRFFQSRSHTP